MPLEQANIAENSIVEGNVLEGVVTGITNFGAFVELSQGKTGLVHISEIADVYVKDIKDFLKNNDRVKVKVLNVDKNGKIGLSIKQAIVKESPPVVVSRPKPKIEKKKPQVSFEDRLAKFMKDSDERQMDLKKSIDAKRGGRGSKKSE